MPEIGLHTCYDGAGKNPLAHILRLGDVKLLLDAGWTRECRAKDLEPIQAALPTIDAVLLSQPDFAHLGGLPLLLGGDAGDGLSCPAYITTAGHRMGLMELYEECLLWSDSTTDAADPGYTLDAVDEVFGRLTTVAFQEIVVLKTRETEVRLTAHPAGHLLGAAIWLIQWNNEDILYAPAFNHRKEQCFAGAQLASISTRPALILADVTGALLHEPPDPAQDAEFLEAVVSTLRLEGTVLIPVDTAGRVLELLLLLEHHWARHRLPYPVAWVGAVASTTLEFARTQTESMPEALTWRGPRALENPFSLKHVVALPDPAALSALPPGPRVVLASPLHMQAGASRRLLTHLATGRRNVVILPFCPHTGGLADSLADWSADEGSELTLDIMERVPVTEDDERHSTALSVTPPAAKVVDDGDFPGEKNSARADKNDADLDSIVAGDDDDAADGADLGLAAQAAEEAVQQQAAQAGPLRVTRTSTVGISRGGTGVPLPELEDTQQDLKLRQPAPPGGAEENGVASHDHDDAGLYAIVSKPLPVPPASATTCLTEGFIVPEGAVTPMFGFGAPDPEEDLYGTVVEYAAEDELSGPGIWGMLAGGAGLDPAQGQANQGTELSSQPQEQRTKLVKKTVHVGMRALILVFRYQGLADRRSLRTILAQAAPRHCVLYGSTDVQNDIEALSQQIQADLAQFKGTVDFVTAQDPKLSIDCGPSLRAELDAPLVAGLKTQKVSEYQLAWLNASLSKDMPPVLKQSEDVEQRDQAGGVLIGDVKLSEIRRALAALAISAEFSRGALYCEGSLVIRRSDDASTTGLTLEGPLSALFYRVQKLIYDQYQVC